LLLLSQVALHLFQFCVLVDVDFSGTEPSVNISGYLYYNMFVFWLSEHSQFMRSMAVSFSSKIYYLELTMPPPVALLRMSFMIDMVRSLNLLTILLTVFWKFQGKLFSQTLLVWCLILPTLCLCYAGILPRLLFNDML
jgi:hypothetical protein